MWTRRENLRLVQQFSSLSSLAICAPAANCELLRSLCSYTLYPRNGKFCAYTQACVYAVMKEKTKKITQGGALVNPASCDKFRLTCPEDCGCKLCRGYMSGPGSTLIFREGHLLTSRKNPVDDFCARGARAKPCVVLLARAAYRVREMIRLQ